LKRAAFLNKIFKSGFNTMKIKREWATPITAGAFLLTAVTGILMFFHLDSGLNKTVHEWLSWILVIGAGLHIVSNYKGFKRHFSVRKGQVFMGGFALLLALSFVPMGKVGGEAPFVAPIKTLSAVPLTTLALVAEVTPEQIVERLSNAGFTVQSNDQSVGDVVGGDLHKQMNVLKTLLIHN
jgi:hypothetical protein